MFLLKSSVKFKERYETLRAASTVSSQGTPPRPSKKQKTQNLLCDANSDDSDSDRMSDDVRTTSATQPKSY